MRPFLDDRLFPGLPKFLWFDDGSGASDGGPGSGNAGTGSNASANTGNTSAGPSATGLGAAADAAAAASGYGGIGAAPSTGPGSAPGPSVGDTGVGGGAAGGTSGGVAGSVSFGGGQASQGASPGVGPAGGVSTAGTTSSGGGTAGGGGATSPGAATGGAATGGGAGTASGGSGVSGLSPSVIAMLNAAFGANPGSALRGAVNLSQLDFGGGGASTGVPSLGVPLGVGGQGAAPVGSVSTSALGPAGYSSNAISSLNSQLAQLARSAGQTFGTSLGNAGTTDQVSPPGKRRGAVPAYQGVPATTMGYPAAGLATTPSGDVAPSGNAPNGSTVGQATINAPPTNPDAPAVGSHNADEGLSGLAQAASTAVNQSNPSVTGGATSSPTSTSSPTGGGGTIGGGGILQTIMSLVASYPPLAQLAQSALTGSQTANRPQNVLSGVA